MHHYTCESAGLTGAATFGSFCKTNLHNWHITSAKQNFTFWFTLKFFMINKGYPQSSPRNMFRAFFFFQWRQDAIPIQSRPMTCGVSWHSLLLSTCNHRHYLFFDTKSINSRYFNFQSSFKLRLYRAQDLFWTTNCSDHRKVWKVSQFTPSCGCWNLWIKFMIW